MKKIILPKTFDNKFGSERYNHLIGKPKLSYSQVGSWTDADFKSGYIKKYICGITDVIENTIYANFGSACGTYLESLYLNDFSSHKEYEHLLSNSDRKILEEKIPKFEKCVYEDYIVIDRGDYVIEGFIDRTIINDKDDMKIHIQDFKTGSIAKKQSYYASKETYMQTNLYAYAKEKEGYEIEKCDVILLDRKGNNTQRSPLKLTGEICVIDTPYSKPDTEKYLKKIDKVAKEISEYYQKYLKYFK